MPRRVREASESLLLDTHVWVWYIEAAGDRLSRTVLAQLRSHGQAGRLYVSPLSGWEVGMLVVKRRLALSLDVRTWVTRALEAPGVRAAELTAHIALDAALLDGAPPRDPADRLLIATSRALGAALVTQDAAILAYGRAGHLAVVDAGG